MGEVKDSILREETLTRNLYNPTRGKSWLCSRLHLTHERVESSKQEIKTPAPPEEHKSLKKKQASSSPGLWVLYPW